MFGRRSKGSGDIFPRSGRTIFEQNQSGYGKIEVREAIEKNELIRLLLVDDVRESAAYMEEGRHYELVFKYTEDLVAPLKKRNDIRSVLLLGGAGFSIPKYIISHYPEIKLDVVEINPQMYQLAMTYFYLDELYRDFRLTEDRRMDVIIQDANVFLRENKRKYDMIINDAYVSNRMDDDLMKDGRVSLIKERLNPDGIYIINLITAVHGPGSMPGILEYEILKNHFKNTDMFPVKKDAGPLERQNCILIGSDGII